MSLEPMETRNRILKGIEYFRSIKPSEFNAGHALHVKKFCSLVEEFINGEPEKKETYEEAKEVFSNEIGGDV
jgi:hypothetical protein